MARSDIKTVKEVNTPMSTLYYETDKRGVTKVVRCVPKDGYSLYEVNATYDKNHPHSSYYRLGSSTAEVIERFQNGKPWLTIIGLRLIPPGEEAEAILTNPNKMPLS